MRNVIKQALVRRVRVKDPRGRVRYVEEPPSQTLLYGIYFAIASLITLTALEVTHIVVLHAFSNEIFAAVTFVIGSIIGAFFGQKT